MSPVRSLSAAVTVHDPHHVVLPLVAPVCFLDFGKGTFVWPLPVRAWHRQPVGVLHFLIDCGCNVDEVGASPTLLELLVNEDQETALPVAQSRMRAMQSVLRAERSAALRAGGPDDVLVELWDVVADYLHPIGPSPLPPVMSYVSLCTQLADPTETFDRGTFPWCGK
jgi:hypothetical protein